MYKSTSQRVKNGLLQMVIGRPLSAVCGLLVLVILSRYLSKYEYGIYLTIWALTELVILLSDFGFVNSAYRYVSSREFKNGWVIVDGPVLQLVLMRFVSLIVVGGFIVEFSKFIPFSIIESEIMRKFHLYIIAIIVSEGMARYIEAMFDSMLCQGFSQFTLIGRSCLRLLLLFVVILHSSTISINALIFIEAGVTAVGAISAFFIFMFIYVRSIFLIKDKGGDNKESLPSVGGIIKFVVPSYLAQVIAIACSPDLLKLVLGGSVGKEALAIFGFAFSVAAVVQRYMPANLLGGVFRPAFVAAVKRNDNGSTLQIIVSLSMKINFIFILPIIAFCLFGAAPILSIISGGNYASAGTVLIILMFWALALSLHLTMLMCCVALEYTLPTFIAAVCSAISLPIGLAVAKYGAGSIAGVILLSEVIWFITCLYFINRRYHAVMVNSIGFMKLFFSLAASTAIVFSLSGFDIPWYILSMLASCVCLIMFYCFRVLDAIEVVWLRERFPIFNKLNL